MGESRQNQNLHYGQPVVEPDFSASVSCPRCNDTGYVMDTDHDDKCDGYTCSPECPVPVQSLCPDCGPIDVNAPCELRCLKGWLPIPETTTMTACVCNVDVRGLAV